MGTLGLGGGVWELGVDYMFRYALEIKPPIQTHAHSTLRYAFIGTWF